MQCLNPAAAEEISRSSPSAPIMSHQGLFHMLIPLCMGDK